MSRRKFLGLGAGLLVLFTVGYKFLLIPLKGFLKIGEPEGLSPEQLSTITLLVNEILPKTARSPSGEEAGVINYLQRAFSGKVFGWLPTPAIVAAGKCLRIEPGYKHFLPHYVRVAERLDILSGNMFGHPFKSLDPEKRSQIVLRFSQGAKADVGYNVKGAPSAMLASDDSLFELVRRHTLEGYFSEPIHGGNINYVAWESIRHVCHYNYPKDQTNCTRFEK